MKKMVIIVCMVLILIFITSCITISIVKNKEYEEQINRWDTKIEMAKGGE